VTRFLNPNDAPHAQRDRRWAFLPKTAGTQHTAPMDSWRERACRQPEHPGGETGVPIHDAKDRAMDCCIALEHYKNIAFRVKQAECD
jgi:hypothetical protein